jgi:hypothetical protein
MAKLTVGEINSKITQKDNIQKKVKEDNYTSKDISKDDAILETPESIKDDKENFVTTKDIVFVEESKDFLKDAVINIPEERPQSYTEEFKKYVLQVSGSFYATYIANFHPSKLKDSSGDAIRNDAIEEIIKFSTMVFEKLGKNPFVIKK